MVTIYTYIYKVTNIFFFGLRRSREGCNPRQVDFSLGSGSIRKKKIRKKNNYRISVFFSS